MKENKGRIFCMGDLHGAHKALVQCLERAKFDKEKDTLIQLGDVADGWPFVYECVEELLSIKNLIAIRGNHDFWTYQWMNSGMCADGHKGQGGQATLDSYASHGISDPYFSKESHYKFFKYQHDYYIDDQKRLFVHGGINPQIPIQEGNTAHNFNWNRSMWIKAVQYDNGPKMFWVDGYKEVYIGHTTTMNWKTTKPMHMDIIWNLDTGAGYAGVLTIMDVDTKEIYQSDLVKELYPDIRGRDYGEYK